MENKIPTAEEFINKNSLVFLANPTKILKEFAKIHVKAALESASENVGLSYKQSILNAYPENLIK